MSERISWALSLDASSGARVTGREVVDVEATTLATIDLDPAMAAAEDFNLQIANTDGVVVFAIMSSLLDGTVSVRATLADATPLTGPLVLYGEAVTMFASDLSTLRVQNEHPTETAQIKVMIGRALSP